MQHPNSLARIGNKAAFLAAGFAAIAALLCAAAPAAAQKGKKKEVAKVIVDKMVRGVPGQKQVNYINEELERLWRDNNVTPSKRCDDYTFIRRASLDIIGRIPKLSEISAFMGKPAEYRRSWLIETLLKNDDYAHNSATVWTTLLMTRSANKLYREQMYLFLFDEFVEQDANWSKIVTKIVTAKGKTNENGAVNFILAHLGEENPAKSRKESGRFEMVPVTSRTTKLFLGLQTQCTQCHDHPFWPDVWQQDDFWGINAFFRQVDAPLGRPLPVNMKMKNFAGQKELTDNTKYNPSATVFYERRNGTLFLTKAKFLDGTKMSKNIKKSRREVLANFIVKSPYFSKAFVNRTWGHFFGVSFTKDNVADFGNHNRIVTPKLKKGESKDWLLGRLAADWKKEKYNPKSLIRWICNSKAYGLDSVANKTNGKRDAEGLFARMLLKAMTPEQLYESIEIAVGYDPGNKKARKEDRERFLDRLVVNFGDDEGNEQTFNGTVIQALLLMNGQEINRKILDKKKGTVAYVIKNGVAPVPAMRHLFMAALNRPPTEAEKAKILNARMAVLPRTPRAKSVREFREGFYQDLFWAILNSNEFFLNH